MLKKILFLLPFASFIGGYLLIQFFLTPQELYVPNLVGKNIIEATELLSEQNLNIRILARKEDTDHPAYTILSQTPQANEKVKPHQSIYLVITTQKAQNLAPSLVHKSIGLIRSELENLGIKPVIHYVPSHFPKEVCIAQSPQPGEVIEKNSISLYFPTEQKKPIIWPDLRGKQLGLAKELLETINVTPQIIAPHHYTIADTSIVLDQRPKSGTLLILDENKPVHVQLSIKN